MDNFYFESAKNWYSEIYISSSVSRVYYFLIFVVFFACCYFSYLVYVSSFPVRIKLSMIAKLNHDEDKKVSFYKMNYKQPKIGIAEYILTRAISQRESLEYSTPATVVEFKISSMKNFFSEEVLQEYEMENLEEDEENDLSFSVKGYRKKLKIDKIIFLDTENRDIRDSFMYKLSLFEDTNKAIAFFTTCNDLLDSCKKYKVFINFEIKLPVELKNRHVNDRIIDFKITSYQKTLLSDEI